MKNEILELYKYQSKVKLSDSYSVIRQDRKSVVLYDFGDVKWVLMPIKHSDITLEDIERYKKYDSTNIMFLKENINVTGSKNAKCWKLSHEDKDGFDVFIESCSSIDRDQGQVSLKDPVVYGCFEKGKIVSVASLWNWGDRLSDIGVLTHPKYRHKGYARDVCGQLISETDRLIIWRCEDKNELSLLLAKELGFEVCGRIHTLGKQ